MHQDPDVDIGGSYAPVGGKILVKMENEVKQKRLYTRAPKDVAKIDVGSMNTEEIDKRMRELYERTDDGWSCLVCDHTNKGKSSNIRNHVEIHMDGLVYTCDLCREELRSRHTLKYHKISSHKGNI